MPRKPRIFSPDVAYHIIARGNNRQTIFSKPADFEVFLFYLQDLKAKFPCDIYNYCLMTNHVHLLMHFPDEESFRTVPQRLFLRYAKYFARQIEHVGHVFQDRFKSFPVQDNLYLLECGRYIERNPIKAGLVTHPADYKWSSARFYLNGEENKLLTTNPLFLDFSSDESQRRSSYEKYVLLARPYEQIIESVLFGRAIVR